MAQLRKTLQNIRSRWSASNDNDKVLDLQKIPLLEQAKQDTEASLNTSPPGSPRASLPNIPSPDQESFESTADPQRSSYLFKLPLELRTLIYIEIWQLLGSSQHIFIKGDGYSYTPCVVRSGEADERPAEIKRIWEEDGGWSIRQALWNKRMSSSWGTHWKCLERTLVAPPGQHPVLTMLLLCKRTLVVATSLLSFFARL